MSVDIDLWSKCSKINVNGENWGLSLWAIGVRRNNRRKNQLPLLVVPSLSVLHLSFILKSNWFSHVCHIWNTTCSMFAFGWMVKSWKKNCMSSMISTKHESIQRLRISPEPTKIPRLRWKNCVRMIVESIIDRFLSILSDTSNAHRHCKWQTIFRNYVRQSESKTRWNGAELHVIQRRYNARRNDLIFDN